MHLDFVDFTRLVIHFDFIETGYEIDLVDRFVVVLHELVALGRTLMVVEGDAGTDYVEHHRSLVGDGGL